MNQTNQNRENSQTFPVWAKALLIGLVVVVALQSWLIVRIGGEGPSGEPVGAAVASAPAQAGNTAASANANTPPRPPQPAPVDPVRSWLDSEPWWLGSAYDSATWDPFRELQRMQEQMDRVFGAAMGRFQRSDRFAPLLQGAGPFTPDIDVRETDENYQITVNLPGMDEPAVQVDMEGQILRISGEVEERIETKNEEGVVLHRERKTGRFQRAMTLPEPVDSGSLTTEFDQGVLRITVPKAAGESSPEEDS